MAFSERFIIHDDGLFVKSFDLDQPRLTMTQHRSEALSLTLVEAIEVVYRLGWLASRRLVVKAVDAATRVR